MQTDADELLCDFVSDKVALLTQAGVTNPTMQMMLTLFVMKDEYAEQFKRDLPEDFPTFLQRVGVRGTWPRHEITPFVARLRAMEEAPLFWELVAAVVQTLKNGPLGLEMPAYEKEEDETAWIIWNSDFSREAKMLMFAFSDAPEYTLYA